MLTVADEYKKPARRAEQRANGATDVRARRVAGLESYCGRLEFF